METILLDGLTVATFYYLATKVIPYARFGVKKPGFRFGEPNIRKPFLSVIIWKGGIYFLTMYLPCLLIVMIGLVSGGPSAATKVHFWYDQLKFCIKLIFGWNASMFLSYVVKKFVFEPRPSFLAMNRISEEMAERMVESTDNKWSEDHPLPEPKSTRDFALAAESKQSFFSGHSHLGIYALSFVVIHTQVMMKPSILRMTFQVACLLVGSFPGITQYRQYWHHGLDLAVGYFFGVLFAFLIYFYA